MPSHHSATFFSLLRQSSRTSRSLTCWSQSWAIHLTESLTNVQHTVLRTRLWSWQHIEVWSKPDSRARHCKTIQMCSFTWSSHPSPLMVRKGLAMITRGEANCTTFSIWLRQSWLETINRFNRVLPKFTNKTCLFSRNLSKWWKRKLSRNRDTKNRQGNVKRIRLKESRTSCIGLINCSLPWKNSWWAPTQSQAIKSLWTASRVMMRVRWSLMVESRLSRQYRLPLRQSKSLS